MGRNFCLGNFSRVPQFCLGNLDLPSKLPRVSTLTLHPGLTFFRYKYNRYKWVFIMGLNVKILIACTEYVSFYIISCIFGWGTAYIQRKCVGVLMANTL